MAIKKVIQHPQKILHKDSQTIINFKTQSLKALIKNMLDTVVAEHGIGLAGVQIGISKKIFIIPQEYAPEIRTKRLNTWLKPKLHTVFINPQIIYYSKKKEEAEEGCLSVKGEYHLITRPEEVVIKAQDEKGRTFKVRADSLLARIFQHETDHLNGLLFLDRLHEK